MHGGTLRFSFAAVLAVVLSSGAAGGELKAGSPAAFSWTGFYFGVDGGYGLGDRSAGWSGNPSTEASYFSSGGVGRSISMKPTGFLGGPHAGYNLQFGHYVVGAETDFVFSNIGGNGLSSTGNTIMTVDNGALPLFSRNNYSQYQNSAGQGLNSLGTLRGRLGILATEQILFYATGGVAYGRATMSAAINSSGVYSEYISASDGARFFTQQYPACTDICTSGSTSRWLVGEAVGAGLEFALFDQWSARAEYIYYTLGRLSVTIADPRFPAQTFSTSTLFAGQIARIGLSYRFH